MHVEWMVGESVVAHVAPESYMRYGHVADAPDKNGRGRAALCRRTQAGHAGAWVLPEHVRPLCDLVLTHDDVAHNRKVQAASRLPAALFRSLRMYGRACCVVLVHAACAAALSCGECTAIQEAIHRSINHNISALEVKALAGTASTATVEIGQIIWHLCGSAAWKDARHQKPMTTAYRCRAKLPLALGTLLTATAAATAQVQEVCAAAH
jgi:hypothetical protein